MKLSILAGKSAIAALLALNVWAAVPDDTPIIDMESLLGNYTVSQATPKSYEGMPEYRLPNPTPADMGSIRVSEASSQELKIFTVSLSGARAGYSMSQFSILRDLHGRLFATEFFNPDKMTRVRRIKQNENGSFTLRPKYDLKFEIKLEEDGRITMRRYVPETCWVEQLDEHGHGKCLLFFNWAEPIRYDWTK